MCHRQQGLRGLILLVLVRLRLLPLLRRPPLPQSLRRHRLPLLPLLRPPPLPRLYSQLRRERKQSRARKPHKPYKQRKQLSLRLTHRPRLSRHRLLPPQPPRPLVFLPVMMPILATTHFWFLLPLLFISLGMLNECSRGPSRRISGRADPRSVHGGPDGAKS